MITDLGNVFTFTCQQIEKDMREPPLAHYPIDSMYQNDKIKMFALLHICTQKKLKCLNKNTYSATDNKHFYVSQE